MPENPAQQSIITIVTPVYNDWDSLKRLVRDLETAGEEYALQFHIFAVNDGSVELPENEFEWGELQFVKDVEIIHLVRNLGHQKAIAIGLAYVNSSEKGAYPVVVMDCDGEDRPKDIASLFYTHTHNPQKIIFAQRARRSEGVIFSIFYWFYRILFRTLTGQAISFGNFCLIPTTLLGRVVYLPEIWNHFAAGIMRAKIPIQSIPIVRGKRYTGQSKMNFVSLVIHGLSAISVYIEILTVRLMLGTIFIIGLIGIGFLVMLYYKFFTVLAIPGWATSIAVGLTVIAFQAILFITLLTFMILNYRSNKLFVPAKDYLDYFSSIESII